MKIHSLTVLAVLTASIAGLTACGGSSGPKIKSFAASDTSIPEGGVDVTFTWDVKNASTLELLPMPGAVTGTSATVNVSESTTFTLVAKKGGRSHKKSIDVVVGEAFDVTGTALNYFSINHDTPAVGATVAIGDRVTLTDENGMFHFENVVAPYDLVVVTDQVALGAFYSVSVFDDVTIANPTVRTSRYNFDSLPDRTAHIAGTVTGTATANQDHFVTIEDEYSDRSVVTPTYDIQYSWLSASPTVAIVQNILEYDDATDTFKHARSAGTLTDTQTLTLSPALVTIPKQTFDVSTESVWGSSETAWASVGFAELGQDGTYATAQYGSLTTANHLVVDVPDLANARWSLWFEGEDDDGEASIAYLQPDPSTLTSVEIPPPPRQLTPVDGATVNAGTRFTVAPQPGSISLVSFVTGSTFGVPGGTFNAYITVYTDKSEVTFPDLAALGFPLPSGTYFSWTVGAIGPWGSLDEALATPYGAEYPEGPVYQEGGTDYRSFVTEVSGDDDDDVVTSMDENAQFVPEN